MITGDVSKNSGREYRCNILNIIRLGTEIFSTKERYMMPVVDTAYIRSEYRNRGFGMGILSDVIARFPNEDIGFSKPISSGMLRSEYPAPAFQRVCNNT